MTSTAVELDADSARARVVSAPAGRDLRRAIRRQTIRRFVLAGLVFGSALGAAWYGYHWWTVGRFIESTDDAYVGGEVTVIAPKVAGFIAEVAVTDNQAVHAGDLLVKLDDRDYRAALAKAAGAVAGAAGHASQSRCDPPTAGSDDRAGRSRGRGCRWPRWHAHAVRCRALSPARR